MQFDNQKTRNVADAVAKILAGETVSEALKGDQHKIDVNKNNKIDSEDFKHLRAGKKPAEVKKEEVENIGEASTYKLGRAAAETKNFPIHHNGEHVGTLEFHTSAGKLHHRVASVKGVPHEKFIGHPDREKMTNAHVAKHEAEARKHFTKKIKEEVEQIQEYESKGGKYVHKGTYGTAKGAEYGETDYDKENEMAKSDSKPKKPARKKYGARQNYVRSSRVNESFSGLLSVYKEQGLKGLSEALVKEEPTNDQYNAELEDNKAKAEGKKKQPNLAQGAIQAVKNEETEIAVIDADKANGVRIDNIEEGLMSGVKNVVKSAVSTVKDVQSKERAFQAQKQKKAGEVLSQLRKEESEEQIDEKEMTDAEMKKREEIVKSMKKGLEGFKQRYGEKAKSVMYATATKQAMKD